MYKGQSRAFRQGEFWRHFQDFRENFWSKFRISLYVLCILSSPSAQNREKSASLGRLFLPNRPLGWALMYKITYDLVAIHVPAADYLIPSTRQSRHNYQLAYRQIPTLKDYYKYIFFPCTIVHWNALSPSHFTSLFHLLWHNSVMLCAK